jgi:hypothetical protein
MIVFGTRLSIDQEIQLALRLVCTFVLCSEMFVIFHPQALLSSIGDNCGNTAPFLYGAKQFRRIDPAEKILFAKQQ